VEVSTKSFAQIVSKCCPTRGRWGEREELEKVFSQGKWEEEEESERKRVRKS